MGMNSAIGVTDSMTFPINRYHQRVVTSQGYVIINGIDQEFPINRCHQRVVTFKGMASVARPIKVSNQ